MSKQDLQHQELMEKIRKLPPEKIVEVEDFVDFLSRRFQSASPTGVRGEQLLRFAGTIGVDDLKIMAQAADEDCEQVDLNEW